MAVENLNFCRRAVGQCAFALLPCIAMASTTALAADRNWQGLYDMDAMMQQRYTLDVRPAAMNFPDLAAARGKDVAPPAPARPLPAEPSVRGAQAMPAQATPNDAPLPMPEKSGWRKIFSEIRIGALAHDIGPFSSREEDGVDANIELLFASPSFMSVLWSPRPTLGVSVNSQGDTSQVYLGLTWEYQHSSGWFASFGFGGMAHDGHLVGDAKGVQQGKSLGCRFLFRESIDIGYRFAGGHSLMAHLDHSSNASLCEKNTSDGTAHGRHDVVLNEGLESVGLRYGYKF